MKIALGLFVVFLLVYFGAKPIYNAMKKHDYDNLYYSIQDAKQRSGGFVAEKEKRFISYDERYARGLK